MHEHQAKTFFLEELERLKRNENEPTFSCVTQYYFISCNNDLLSLCFVAGTVLRIHQ